MKRTQHNSRSSQRDSALNFKYLQRPRLNSVREKLVQVASTTRRLLSLLSSTAATSYSSTAATASPSARAMGRKQSQPTLQSGSSIVTVLKHQAVMKKQSIFSFLQKFIHADCALVVVFAGLIESSAIPIHGGNQQDVGPPKVNGTRTTLSIVYGQNTHHQK
jgi:hypothetical protein